MKLLEEAAEMRLKRLVKILSRALARMWWFRIEVIPDNCYS